MAHLHLSAELPSDPAARTRLRAAALHTALSHAVASPEFRLDMILGEASGRVIEVARWIVAQLAKEEATAPGLTHVALTQGERLSATEWTRRLAPLLLSAAATLLVEVPSATPRQIAADGPGGLTIDHDG